MKAANELYDRDFYAWTQATIDLIKQQKFEVVDWENLTEELETLGRREKRAVKSYLVVLLLHLLKWQYQPEYRSRSWEISIRNCRRELQKLLQDNPSLAGDFLTESLDEVFREAREKASEETTIFLENFPLNCPYALAQIQDRAWLPT